MYSDFFRSFIDSWKKFEGHKAGLADLLTEDEGFQWIGDFSRLCFARVAERQPAAKIVLEKTPGHALCGRDIFRLFPNCYFIHVIRDPRAVVTSLRAASRSWGTSWAPERIRDACEMWNTHVISARSIADLTPKYREVFYEHLHANGPMEIVGLFDWLGEPITRDRAELYVAACAFDRLEPADRRTISKKKVDRKFFRRGEVSSWRTELPASDIAIVERLTKKQMARLGYEPVSGRRARLVAKARLRAYKAGTRLEAAAHGLTEWLKP